LFSRIVARQWRLPPAIQRKIKTEELRIPMRDGIELRAIRRYAPDGHRQPAVLIRSCYGITGPFGFLGTLFAERGFQVILQNCRGVGGSQGVFRPFFDEQNDGEDTVNWIAAQPWFGGNLALWGGSYLGNTAWAIANSPAAAKVKAMGLHVTLTNFRDRTYAFGGYTLEASMGWTITMAEVARSSGMNLLSALTRMRRSRMLIEKAIAVLPLKNADRVVSREGVSWWPDWMNHAEPGDPYWDPIDYGRAAETTPAMVMSTGWYDIFLPWQLTDFITAQRAGRDVRLIVGPWMHAGMSGTAESLRETIALFQEQFGLTARQPAKPRVRLFLMGADEWRDYPSWPVPGAIPQNYFLRHGGALSPNRPSTAGSSKFDYDPSQPTPSLHGPTIEGKSGSGDMAPLERRSDVLLFTSEPLVRHTDVIGPISGELYLRSNTQYGDIYLSLCDVNPAGLSRNVCDGYQRLRPESPPALPRGHARKVTVEFWPTAYRFQRGHRVRVIVAGGAHPRYVRNLGTGEPLGEGQTMITQHYEILHGPEHPSAITLSVLDPA
jgi:putative CocE/NonD family hydrolase